MDINIIHSDKVKLNKADIVILIIPYSFFNDEVRNNFKLFNHTTVNVFTKLVDTFIKHDIYNIYICVYNVDNTRYKINMSRHRLNIVSEVNKLINNVFRNIHDLYKDKGYRPVVQGKYFPTSISVTRMIIGANMFGSSRRTAINFDGRRENPIFNDDIRTELKGKLDNVIAALLIKDKPCVVRNDLDEDIFEHAWLDVITYSFIPIDNGIRIFFKDD